MSKATTESALVLQVADRTVELRAPTHGELDFKRWQRLNEALRHHWSRMDAIESTWPEDGSGVDRFDSALRAATDTLNAIGATLKALFGACALTIDGEPADAAQARALLEESSGIDASAAKLWLEVGRQLTDVIGRRIGLGKS